MKQLEYGAVLQTSVIFIHKYIEVEFVNRERSNLLILSQTTTKHLGDVNISLYQKLALFICIHVCIYFVAVNVKKTLKWKQKDKKYKTRGCKKGKSEQVHRQRLIKKQNKTKQKNKNKQTGGITNAGLYEKSLCSNNNRIVFCVKLVMIYSHQVALSRRLLMYFIPIGIICNILGQKHSLKHRNRTEQQMLL